MKKIKQILIMGLLMLTALSNAQVKIGDNVTTVDSKAVLELESTTKGFVPPRMTTVQRDAMSTNVKGMMIYNTTKECMEVFIGTGSIGADAQGWKNMCAANVKATFTNATLNCGGTLLGDYVATVNMAGNNKKIVTITVVTPGDYTATTDEVNGVIFSAEGTIQTSGAGVQIVLKAAGTPSAAGAFTYTVTLGGQTCTFSVTYANPPASLLNDAVDCFSTSAVAGTYSPATAMTSSNTKSVKVTPTSIGYCNLTTDTVNGVTFTASTTFIAVDVNAVKTLTMVATGTPTTSGTFTYTIGGTNVNSTCTFTVTYVCPKITSEFLSAATANGTPGTGSHRFTVTAPGPGKILLFGSANMFLDPLYSTADNIYTVRGNGVNLTAVKQPNACPKNVWQNVPFATEFSVNAAGNYNVDYLMTYATGFQDFKLEYIYIPSYTACTTPTSISSGKIDVSGAFNNNPATGTHRFAVAAPSAGKFILITKANFWSNIPSTNMSLVLVNGSTTIGSYLLNNDHYYNAWQTGCIYNEFTVTSAGTYNFDLSSINTSGVSNPSMEWLFIPSGSTAISTGHSETAEPINTPAVLNHRFTLTAPAAGRFVLLGAANIWNSTSTTKGIYVKNGSTILETCNVAYVSPVNAFTLVPFTTQLVVSGSGTYNIDIVPNNVNSVQGMRRVYLQWIFIPN